MIINERSIHLTPEEEQATRLPSEFTWEEVGFRHRELTERTRVISETMREITSSSVVTVGVMSKLAIEQYHLTLFAHKLETAIIGRAHSQMELGGVITQYATARQQLPDN